MTINYPRDCSRVFLRVHGGANLSGLRPKIDRRDLLGFLGFGISRILRGLHKVYWWETENIAWLNWEGFGKV